MVPPDASGYTKPSKHPELPNTAEVCFSQPKEIGQWNYVNVLELAGLTSAGAGASWLRLGSGWRVV